MAFGGLVAFYICFYFKLQDGYWAIISIAAVTQHDYLTTCYKTLLRLSGTALGASFAYGCILLFPTAWLTLLFFSGLFLCIALSLAASKYRYFMIVAGITYTLVMCSGLISSIEKMAIIRTYEVFLGCFICLAMAFLCRFIFKNATGSRVLINLQFKFHKTIVLEALMLTVACAITFVTWQWLDYPLGFWGTISCLFVIEEDIGTSFHNAFKRVLAHVCIVGFAAIVAVYIPGSNPWVALPMGLGLFFSGYTLGIKTTWLKNIGNTMGIALAAMLLTTSPGMTQEDIVMWRFINIIYGVTVAFLTMYIIGRWVSKSSIVPDR